MLRENEVHKFSDGTLIRVLHKLDHMVKDFRLFKYNLGMKNRIWSEDDKRMSEEFMEDSRSGESSRNIQVLPKYHSEDGNPARANIKQALGRAEGIYPGTLPLDRVEVLEDLILCAGNPVKEVLLKLNLPVHRYTIHTVKRSLRNQRISRWRYNLTSAESKFKTPHARSSR
nr:hypothetical protein [Tanacetum cinerariifolium]